MNENPNAEDCLCDALLMEAPIKGIGETSWSGSLDVARQYVRQAAKNIITELAEDGFVIKYEGFDEP